jgi:uncharacterized protein DUF4337
MPEEIEVPTEHLHETIHERLEEESGPGARWITAVALTAAILAVLAAIASLLAGHHANEAMLEQIQASDSWAFYQAKSIKGSVLETRLELLAALGKPVPPADQKKLAGYESEGKQIEERGKELEGSSRNHMAHHNVLARAVTVLQIAIALAAVAVLTRRRQVWYLSLLLGLVGAGLIGQSLFV